MVPDRPTDKQIERLVSVIDPFARITRPKLYGTENVPTHGALLVGNHTLYGLLDVPFMMAELWKREGVVARALGDHAHFTIPGWRDLLELCGTVRGTRENVHALMEAGENVLVFPGGAREVNKRRGEKYQLIWKERLGFAKLAIEHSYPIVPFAAVGAEEMFDIVIDDDHPVYGRFTRLVEKAIGWPLQPIVRGIGPTMLPRPERLYFSVRGADRDGSLPRKRRRRRGANRARRGEGRGRGRDGVPARRTGGRSEPRAAQAPDLWLNRMTMTVEALACDDRGSGDVLVLIHGHPFDRGMWAPQLESLSASLRVIAVDLPGYGESPVRQDKVLMRVMARAVLGQLDALDVEHFTVCGLSMGGLVAMELGLARPQRVSGIVLAATTAAPLTPEEAADRLAVADEIEREGMVSVALEMAGRLFGPSGSTRRRSCDAVFSMMMAAPPRARRRLCAGAPNGPDYATLLRDLHVPALVVAGDADSVLHRGGHAAVARRAAGPGVPAHARLWAPAQSRGSDAVRRGRAGVHRDAFRELAGVGDHRAPVAERERPALSSSRSTLLTVAREVPASSWRTSPA